MYLFHKKTKVLRVLALLCAFALGLCMTGGFQMTEACQRSKYSGSFLSERSNTSSADLQGWEIAAAVPGRFPAL